jgi:hypothetical protein
MAVKSRWMLMVALSLVVVLASAAPAQACLIGAGSLSESQQSDPGTLTALASAVSDTWRDLSERVFGADSELDDRADLVFVGTVDRRSGDYITFDPEGVWKAPTQGEVDGPITLTGGDWVRPGEKWLVRATSDGAMILVAGSDTPCGPGVAMSMPIEDAPWRFTPLQRSGVGLILLIAFLWLGWRGARVIDRLTRRSLH